jgi:hypothetical protein
VDHLNGTIDSGRVSKVRPALRVGGLTTASFALGVTFSDSMLPNEAPRNDAVRSES